MKDWLTTQERKNDWDYAKRQTQKKQQGLEKAKEELEAAKQFEALCLELYNKALKEERGILEGTNRDDT